MTRHPALCPSRTRRLAALLLAALALASAPVLAQQEGVTVTATRGSDGDTEAVSWTAYTGTGFQYYRVIVCDDSKYDGSSCNGTDFVSNPIWNVSNTGPVNVSGLDAEKGYGVILQVWRNGSALKVHATLPAPQPALPPPAAPTGLIAIAGHNRAAIAWDDPSDASITGYEYALQQVGSDRGEWITIRDSNADTTYHLIRNLTNGTAYVIHLRALNGGGASDAAQAGATPETPTIIVQDGDGNAITELSIPEGGEVSYQVKLGSRILTDITLQIDASDPSNNLPRWYKNTDPDITLKDGQRNGLRVVLTFTPENWDTAQTVTLVAAEDSDAVHGMRDLYHDGRLGYSPKTRALTVTEIDDDTVDPPAAPTGLTAAAEHKRAAITWNDPSDASITGYEYALQQVGNDQGEWVAIGGSHAGTTYHLIKGLTNGTAYTIHLRALNAGGAGAAAQTGATPKAPTIIVQDGNGNAITGLSIPEGGEVSYQVKPGIRPRARLDMDLTLSSGTNNDPDVTFRRDGNNVATVELVFTPENWDTAQTVTLGAAEDVDDLNGVRYVIHKARKTYTDKQAVLTVTEIDNERPVVTAVRGNGGDTATVSWTAYTSAGFQYYRVIVCDDSQYNGQSCNGTVFKSDAIWNANSTGPVTVTGLDANTGYGVILQVWRNGSAIKVHATLPAAASSSAWGAAGATATAPPTGYVTNLASARSGGSDVDAALRQAAAFTTGPNPGGYVLKSFTAALRKVGGDADLVLTLHETASDGQPAAAALATLSGRAPTSGAFADVTYTCSGTGCRLAPHTTYFVAAASAGSGAYAWAYVASASLYTETTAPADSGWDIGSGSYSANGGKWTDWEDWHHARVDFEAPQSPVVTVGNLDRPAHEDACFPSGDTRCAVAFTTGGAANGYTLAAITARFAAADDPDGLLGDLVATLHAGNAGLPGALLATLSGSNPHAAGDHTYTCSGTGCALSPETTYFVQFTATAGASRREAYEWVSTLSDHETAVPSGNGWTLANGTAGYGSSWTAYPDVGLLRVRAVGK